MDPALPLPAHNDVVNNPTGTTTGQDSGVMSVARTAGQKIMDLPFSIKLAIGVALIFALCIVLTKCYAEWRKAKTHRDIAIVQRLIKDAGQSGTKSKQDSSALVALRHADYAVAYAKAARHIMSDADIARHLRIDLSELIYMLTDRQEKAMQQCIHLCPALQPEDGAVAVTSGWLG